MKPRQSSNPTPRSAPRHAAALVRSKSRCMAARFWRGLRARRFLCRWHCPASRRGFAYQSKPRLRDRGGGGDCDGRAGADCARAARTLALAAAATTSTRSTRRNSHSSRPFCARRWSAAAWQCLSEIAVLAARAVGLSQSHPAGLRCGGEPRLSRAALPCGDCQSASARLPRRCWWRLRWRLAEVARQFGPALRPAEISLFCDADETALLASVFTRERDAKRFRGVCAGATKRFPR